MAAATMTAVGAGFPAFQEIHHMFCEHNDGRRTSHRAPAHEANAARYDADCQEALAPHVDDLLNQAETVGWDRVRAASALMYLAAKRLSMASR